MLIIEENADRGAIVGNSSMPTYNSFPQTAAWFAIAHPSLPNYLALFSGSTHGTEGSDCPPSQCSFPGAGTLAGQLTQAGIPYAGYMEDMPSQCYTGGDVYPYIAHHNPFAYFPSDPGVSNHSCPVYSTTGNVSQYVLGKFAQDLNSANPPDFVWYTPNVCNDGHDCSRAQVDISVRILVNIVAASRWCKGYAGGCWVGITWDENSESGGPNDIATSVISPTSSSVKLNSAGTHYGTLRSLEDAYGLPYLSGAVSSATPLVAGSGGSGPLQGGAPVPGGANRVGRKAAPCARLRGPTLKRCWARQRYDRSLAHCARLKHKRAACRSRARTAYKRSLAVIGCEAVRNKHKRAACLRRASRKR
jgi:phosphatidylinositol-3-phosphatase